MNQTLKEKIEGIKRTDKVEKERFSQLSKKEQIQEEIEKATKDYNACAMVINFDGMEECMRDIEILRKRLERETE